MAAFADGSKTELERNELKRIVDSMPNLHGSPATLYQKVLLQQVSTAEVAVNLPTPGLKNLAYEMAVCVCEADDVINEQEKKFLSELRSILQLDPVRAEQFQKTTEEITIAPLAAPPPIVESPSVQGMTAPQPGGADMERQIMNYSILNGALELLPDSLATMAIIPLQMKIVHGIGKQFGYSLDRGHITEFAATIGVGLTSQVVEGYARKLVKGLFGKVGGSLLRGLGGQLTSSAMSFATTYALGQAAKAYYAGGRRMSAIELKNLFGKLSTEAQSLHSRYIPQIQERARGINLSQLVPMISGKQP
jgi:uncharacterized protein (DUF697 family)